MNNKFFIIPLLIAAIIGIIYLSTSKQSPNTPQATKHAPTISIPDVQINSEHNKKHSVKATPIQQSTQPPIITQSSESIVNTPNTTSNYKPKTPTSSFNAVALPTEQQQYTIKRLQAKKVMPDGPAIKFEANVYEVSIKTDQAGQDDYPKLGIGSRYH